MNKKKYKKISEYFTLGILIISLGIILTSGITCKVLSVSLKTPDKKPIKAKRLISEIFQNSNSQKNSIISRDMDNRPKIAVIIDDIGWNLNIAEMILKIDAPITFSILPELEFSQEIAVRADRQGSDILLHMPMEPHGQPLKFGALKPLKISMNTSAIVGLTTKYIYSIPHLVGVNNHQGSRFTENEKGMRKFMDVLKRKNLFFVDSRTTPRTVGYNMAKKMGLPTARRQVFLDNELDSDSIEKRIKELEGIAMRNGSAIGIGHPHRKTIIALNNMVDRFNKDNRIRVVPVSTLVQ